MEIVKIKNKYNTEFEIVLENMDEVIDFIQKYTKNQELQEIAWMKNSNKGLTYDN